ncbi:MAG: hypothetical protein H7Y42_07850 [Chitinophagaceae bacterium]|nr:hypothetical protein [Chitinophagaceae bacterium]
MGRSAFIIAGILLSIDTYSQKIRLDANTIEAVNVYMAMDRAMGREVLKVIKDSAVKKADEPTYVKIRGVNFKNGTIEVKVLGRLLKNATEFARGFIGVAFRINDSNTKFESIYIRPTNGRANDQVRRNHSTQYFSYPDYKFDRLRKEAPERYESYADMELNKWITLRIEIQDAQAKLFIDRNEQPCLIVNDLKHGADAEGGVGLWVDVGTEGFFKDLKITKRE